MRNSLLIGACLAAALCACSKQDPAPATEEARSPVASTASAADTAQQAPARQQRKPVTAQEIDQIRASGRSGFWSEPDAFCTDATRQQATLFWNIEGKTKGVTVVLVDKAGKERRIGQGGPVGRKTTGRWLKAGSTFLLRDKESKAEVGKLAIAGKQC